MASQVTQAKGLTPAEAVALDRLDEYERTRHSFEYGGIELGFVKPTKATEQRLRPDPLNRLLANETITKEQARAGVEIRTIYECLVSSMLARAGTAERVARGGGGMPERLATLHATRYLPWAYYLGGRPHGARDLPGKYAKIGKTGRCPIALEIAIGVVVENRTLSEIEGQHHWRHGRAAEFVRYALVLYSDIAGWEQNRDFIAEFEVRWCQGTPTSRAR